MLISGKLFFIENKFASLCVLFTQIILALSLTAHSTTYYFAANGSNANNGTSTSTPWQTLGKLNTIFSSLNPGDNLLFRRGDVFTGGIGLNKAGVAGFPITIGAYGTGANPVITGFTTVSGWTNLGNNIWESTNTVSTLTTCNMVVINGVNTPMGRYPNAGYLAFQSHVGRTSITSSSLNSADTDWTGAEVVIRKDRSIIDRSLITAQTGSTLTYTSGSANDAIDNSGFFIQNDLRTLDQQNEWFYNPVTKKLDVYSGTMPTGVKVANINVLVSVNSFMNFLTFDGVDFQGANSVDVKVNNDSGIVIQNCNISFAGSDGINSNLCTNLTIQNCTISNSNNNAIHAVGFESPPGTFLGGNALISHNTITNTGMFPGMFAKGDNRNGFAIRAEGTASLIEYNVIQNTGFNGIHFDGNSSIIRNNFINYFCLVLDDGGGIYAWNGASTPHAYTGRKVQNNIILNGVGETGGTPPPARTFADGIYMDDAVQQVEISGNAVANCSRYGMSIHNAHDLNIHDNVVYNSLHILSFQQDLATSVIQNNVITKNIFVAKLTGQLTNYYRNYISFPISSLGQADSNYYARPIDDNLTMLMTPSSGVSVSQNLSQWQSYSGLDAHSKKSPKAITDTNDLRFEYNATSTDKTISLGSKYIDVKNVTYNGTITLSPYSAVVLIKNGTATNQSPTANAGVDQTITLPTSAVSLIGSGNDPDGNISAYEWTEISGPPSANINSASSASTTITSLVQGIYQFQLKVTDNNGATALSAVQVTVNAANIPPTANAGVDQTITLPTSIVSLIGSGNDPDGNISAYEWTEISGPPSANITNASSASTTITSLVQGIYQFQLKVTDNNGATAISAVQVTVNAANIPPTANAGVNQTITLPTSIVSLIGSGNDPDGNISAYEWTEISGPPSANINSASSASTTVTSLVQGIYQFQLKVTDNNGATALSAVQVTVNAANIPPTANAGVNQTITLPTSAVSLIGSGNDPDGNISAYEWTEISGPPSANINNASSASTTITSLVQGIYQFQLKVTDNNGATAINSVQVTVNAANIPPTANAGVNQTITLPTSAVSLIGSGNDPDGNISAYEWTEISGPPSANINSASSASTTITSLVQGIYQFQLKVTDNNGATAINSVQVTVNAANIPPTANAGIDQTITLPTSAVSLIGSGNDPDGNISAYEWTEISGPPSANINSASSASTTITSLVQGIYQFQLKVTDNNGATALSAVQVTVNAANIPPTANAGVNQTITLPTSAVSLIGSGNDPDGNISVYEWTEISGPPSANINSASSASTTVTSLVQGIYQFQLKVTDNNGATALSAVQVTVNAANIPPTANAGVNQTITLPTSAVSLIGSGNDPDGNISAYEWTEISGPPSANITNASSASTTITSLVQGIYQFQLKVTDNNGATAINSVQVTVNAANIPPTANAGVNQTITLPTSAVSLIGSGNDPDGNISAYEWTEISGPPSANINSASSASTTVTSLVQGIYQFQLKVTDNNGATALSAVQVTVNAANIPPTANAGVNQTITLPTSAVSLIGSGNDPDGNISAYEWTEISGPPSANINNASSASTTITSLVQGIYQFQLKVTDNNGATAISAVQVTVNAANIPPTANAGVNQTITLPTSAVSLIGSGNDPDGNISAYEWTEISGPPSANITNASSASTTITSLVQGIYQFQLKVTDNNGATAINSVQVTVNAANIPPTANAGVNQTITLPTSAVSLIGSGNDPDGNISAYEWTEISGPPSANINSASSASTTVTSLVQGIYQFQLKVTDNNGATALSAVQVTVNAANIPPTANAGVNQTITLPTSIVSLIGSGNDPDGNISAYEWTEISGPPSANINNASSASTTITSLVQGIYQFQLKVTDNNGATAINSVQVTVNAANIPPTANAGVNQTITLPTSAVSLIGSGNDPDGNISAYEWTEISGPPSANITNASSASTTITSLVQGIYQFQLKVTDNNGATALSAVQVTVNAANIPPVADAGNNILVLLPANTGTLTGSGIDDDGTISSYSWTKISGPASGTIVTPNAATTGLNSLVQGIYIYQLMVTDNNGATGTATVQVTVDAPPIANAGSNILISLPTNTTTLTGSGNDVDGTISSYAWIKISGPTSGTIVTPNAATTVLNSLVQGIYIYQLTVTDNNEAIGTATVQVKVNAPPTANAGIDQILTLPTSIVTLSGSGTDPDGTISSYAWTKISGPLSGTITSASSASTTVTSMVQGIYQFQLKVTDNDGATALSTVQITVNAANIPPTANAGSNILISLPTNTTTLTGSGSDVDGTISSYAWTKISGPASGTIVTPSAATTVLNSLIQGIYIYQLMVTDNNGTTGTATVQVKVNAPPTANAGIDQIITLPTSIVTLSGSGTDPDGTISSYAWTKISGPLSGTITNAASASTTVTSMVQGIYQFQLKVTDNDGATAVSTVQITVNAANIPPTANAGSNILISLPTNTTTLTGSGSDVDGTISSYAWTKISGPASGTIVTPNAATTALNSLVQGIYIYQLMVTDNNGATGTATVQVTVNAAPTANAGSNILISLPTNTTTLTGSGSDVDGTISGYAWIKISGPTSGTIVTPSAATTVLNNLVQGIYIYQLMVTDNNGATGTATVQVKVNAPPTANAGIDQIITLPTSIVTLSGSGTDPDGTISSYAWTKISGPLSGTITNASSASTTVTSLAQGIYQFQLKVTDNDGATAVSTVQVTVNAANIPPTANAGSNILISLPTNTTTLTGSGSDVDGTISSYAWTKISGPASGTIVTPSAATTALNSLVQGIYIYQLMVTDNNGATGTATLQVTVNAAPTANAGSNILISLPTNTTTLTGSGSDVDGTISSYAWTKISGPASGTIVTPSAATTALNNLVQGIYIYQLKATDNNGATGTATVQVTVNAAPTANAGSNILISLPTNTTTLTGSGSDVDGTISSYAWTKISGPASGTIVTPSAATTVLNNLVQGIYIYQLMVTDNNGATGTATVQVKVNAPPTANAGIDQIITLPTSTITLSGSGTDPDGTISSYAWTKISGPLSGTITSASSASTTVTSMVQGIYQFQLKVTDNDGATSVTTVQVIVNAANIPPTANAGSNILISLPTNTTTLTGSGSDVDGTISSYAWTKISGPASGTIVTPNAATTLLNSLVQGIYIYQLMVTDNNGATGIATVQVKVNVPPTANAGIDQIITLPTSIVTLSGSGTDPDGTISSYAWTKISGPLSGTITNAASASTTVTSMVQGIYQFQLKVTDNDGASALSTVQVTVNAANIPPTANAGSNILISLPTNTTTLTGSGSDVDGTISGYAWTKISGPASGTIVTPSAATTVLNNLVQGIYIYQLMVTDNNGATGTATVQVTVNAAPTANAGSNILISLPTNTTTLTGSGSDVDGTISGYAWIKISGPTSGTIVTPSAATTVLNNLVQGIYIYQLMVTDNNGATGTATVQVKVNAPPTANAGIDQIITLPTSTITLSGSGTDPDGTISSYAWTKISGPLSGTITSASSASTTVTSMVQGIYQFQLKVTDNDGATAVSTVQVTVNAANIPPTANAGSNILISLPTNTTTLTGSGSDVDGTISGYAWTKISGPASGTIVTPNAATTVLNSLVQGIYIYQLKVTDNNGATGTATVQVTVNAAPTANAGSNILISLPTNTTTLTGSGSDVDGTISSYAWTKISGPASGTIVTPSAATTVLNSLVQGIYIYQLKVTDNNGATGTATVQVTVNAAPTANAGTDQAITLPTSTVSLSGSGTDPDGTVSAFSWTKLTGSPSGGTITSSTSASTTITALIQGVYKFQLKVTDNKGATGLDTVQITVNAANIAPTAHAGTDQIITLPTSTVSLSGSGTDPDGTISAFSWTKLTGSPSGGTITSSTSASTTITALIQGVYKFQLKVTDNKGATGLDTVQVTVNAANIAPTAHAGTDQIITLPTSTVSLSGSGTDPDGTISAFSWTKLTGSPSGGTITSSTSASTTITALIQGVYKFQLKVTDNKGATGLDTVQVTVNAANIAPTAHAGTDQAITLPTSTVSLSGSGTDPDGTISAFSWTKLTGSPSGGTITSSTSASTTITALIQGVYKFQLKVTDNKGATGLDTVQITVNAANIAPTAHAGTDQAITLPTSTVTLSGSGTDPDGTISAFSWTKLTGSPSGGTITSSTSASTTITALIQGVYKFQLKVTDNKGATGLDTVQVTVNAANIAPTAHAGTDKNVALPTRTTTLSGSGTDPDGTIASFSWTKLTGSPSGGTITSSTSASTTITALIQGVYKYQLMVTDNKGATGKDTVQVTVAQSLVGFNLTAFNATPVDDNINLTWQTSNEKNISGFTIEKKTINNWEEMGYIHSTGDAAKNKYFFNDYKAVKGSNYYRLKVADMMNRVIYSDTLDVELPARNNIIYQNVPNPFSSITTIPYEVPERGRVKIIIYKATGSPIIVLVDAVKEKGAYQVQWDASNIASGTYFYSIIINNKIMTGKMLKLN